VVPAKALHVAQVQKAQAEAPVSIGRQPVHDPIALPERFGLVVPALNATVWQACRIAYEKIALLASANRRGITPRHGKKKSRSRVANGLVNPALLWSAVTADSSLVAAFDR
jgi:hypothetical protein